MQSDIATVSNGTIDYLRSVHHQFTQKLTDVFCRLIAPGQETQLKTVLEDVKIERSTSESTFLHLKEAFESCTSRQAWLSVLMLVPKEYSKSEVCDRFGCTFYEIEETRSILKQYGACAVQPIKERVYSRLSVAKCRHFIDFLSSTGLLQEVAYGTTKLKLDSGETLTVANTVMNGIREHAVKEYIIHCKELNYDPLGCTSLRKILGKMKAHTRTKLAGVDSFVVDGIESFEVTKYSVFKMKMYSYLSIDILKALRKCVKLLGNDEGVKELLEDINSSESYLKARFKTHCNFDDTCSSHCIKHALSHPTDKDLSSTCNEIHYLICGECLKVYDCLATLKLKIAQLPFSHRKEIAQYEISTAGKMIMDWQKHIMRGVQQSKARSNVMQHLDLKTTLWIRDFAQKYLPTKVYCFLAFNFNSINIFLLQTLEAMTEYFGKRGMTISVEVFIYKVAGIYCKQVYLVALDRCDQNLVDTLCIADLVLQQFKNDYPHIDRIELKTDNAGSFSIHFKLFFFTYNN